MEIKPKNNNQINNPSSPNQQVAESASILFNYKNKKITVKKARIKQITKGLAEIACSLGATEDPEEFAETLSEEIYESMAEAKEKIEKEKKK